MLKWLLTLIILLCSSQVWALTYYVRSDGSSNTNCTGLADAAYDGSGTGEACAFNHPHWVIPNRGQGSTATNLAAADTVVIRGPDAGTGVYRMGCQDATDCVDATVNLTVTADCHSSYSYDCYGNPVADGTSSVARTTIIGCTTSGCGGSTPPILWGAGRNNAIINLDGSDHILIKDIEITDHAAGTQGEDAVCDTGASTLGALDGIYANSGSDIVLENVNIHGICRYGMKLGGVEDLTLTNVKINRNGHAGWSLDSCAGAGTCGMTGDITIDNAEITYNGCAEDYPSIGLLTAGCHGQADGVIADGIESANGAGDWVITDSNISHNTQDGLDLLYINNGSYSGGTVTIKRSRFEGNAGNQIKGPNAMVAEDFLALGNCGYFTDQTFTAAGWSDTSDSCRASGNTIAIAFRDATTTPKLINGTLLSNGDVGIETSGTCTAGTDVIATNMIMLGGRQFNDDTSINGAGGNDTASIFYNAGSCSADFAETYNICYGWKEGSSACNGSNSTDTVDPLLIGGTIPMGPVSGAGYYTDDDLYLQVPLSESSSAINAADEGVSGADALDYLSVDRGASWDIGAYEYVASGGGYTGNIIVSFGGATVNIGGGLAQ